MKSLAESVLVGKYGISDKLSEISAVSCVSGESEVEREGNPVMSGK